MAELPPLPPGFSLDQPQQSSGPVTIGSPRPPAPPSGYEKDPTQPGHLQPIPGGPADKPSASELKQIPAAAVAGIQSNIENLRAVDAAIAALKGRPESIGPGTGMLGDTFTQFHDPDGQDVRSRVGQIGAVKIHDLSGAAVSASEAPRFQPFVPTT